MAGFAPKIDDEVDPTVAEELEQLDARDEEKRGFDPKKRADDEMDAVISKLIDIVTTLHKRLDEVERNMRPRSDSERYMPGERPLHDVAKKRYH